MDANASGVHSNNNDSHSSNSFSSAVNFSSTRPAIPPSPARQPSDTHRPSGWPELEEPGPSEDPLLSLVDRSLRKDLSFLGVVATPLLRSTFDPDAESGPDDGGVSARLRERSAGLTSRPIPQSTTSSSFINALRRASTRAASVRGDYIPLEEVGGHLTSNPMLDGIKGTTQPLDIPLRGYALGILGSANPLRVWLYKLLIQKYTEPTILALIIVNAVALVVQASRTLLLPPDKVPITVKGYFHAWEDFVIFVLFIIFTIEAFGRICLTGLLLDPDVPTSSLFSFSNLSRIFDDVASPFSLSQSSHAPTPPSAARPTRVSLSSSASHTQSHSEVPEPPTVLSRIMKSDVIVSDPDTLISLPFQLFRLELQVARSRIKRNIPYLRQGWGRIDFLAVTSFWVSFALATAGLERGTQHIGIFRAFSVLRIARLLAVTNGTTMIMRSLKIARPLLASVIYFIVFAMVLFSVIGVQAFKMSLRRSCTLFPVLGADTTWLDQACGGHINATTLVPSPYLLSNGTPASTTKGFICPLGQVCQEGENPFGGVESFDTVYYAVLQIVVLVSAKSWARVMYQIMASEHDVASLFFILGVLVLNFWLFNLLIAVIANSFSAIRAGTKRSAFGAAPLGPVKEAGWFVVPAYYDGSSRFKVWWSYTHPFWVALSLTTLMVQATANAHMSAKHQEIINTAEFIFTVTFDIEIVVRIAIEFPKWRNFFLHLDNWLDLIIAIGCTIIQIPVIRNSSVYPWLTLFQLARFFRVLLVVPRMKPLMMTVFGNMYGLVNMTLFLMLITFLAALFAIQLIQGDMPGNAPLNFGQLFNSFLGVYQILSGENWTALLYDVTGSELIRGQTIIVCIFLCCWLLFSNFVVMQMFIAVINENFIAEEEAKSKKPPGQPSQTSNSRWLSKLNPYRWLKRRSMALWSTWSIRYHELAQGHAARSSSKSRSLSRSPFNLLHRLFTGERENALRDLYRALFESRKPEDPVEYETDQHLDILTTLTSVPVEPEDIHSMESIELIRNHPSYDKTLWIFPQTNPLRRFCQMIVRPSGGKRAFGRLPSKVAHTFFQLALLLAVVGSVITEAVATPPYRLDYYTQHGPTRGAWFHITDATFGLILVVEFLIKIVADGFLFAPNAYIRSVWNILDFVVMVGVLVNATFTLVFVTGLSRFIRALKALQALRFMTLIGWMRNTFDDLTPAGFFRIIDAAALAMLYIIPFSVWGTNIFAGLMNQCNDLGVKGIEDCTNEYVNTIHGNNFGFLVPRVWDRPSPSTTFSFDNFHSSLLILFEIVSQTGWVDVMSVAMSITGKDLQPRINASQINAIFFVVYNLLGAVVVLTLFVSIIIGNFTSLTGAYATAAQREWMNLQKLIKRLKPYKRPKHPPTCRFRHWCYNCAIRRHVWWGRMMTLLFAVQMFVLMTQSFSAKTANDWHNMISLIISLIYAVDVIIRLYGLGWRFFLPDSRNLFDVVVASGSSITTILVRFYPTCFAIQLLQKLFLVSMTFKLVHSVASLNQLFATAIASLPVILNLLCLWLTFFLFFAITYMEVFGLTKWQSAEDSYRNYQTMGSALLMLVSLSTGEGWNQFMHDYTIVYPRCTQVSHGIYQTDCGSTAWAYVLFIAWNLLSMYIFLNTFIALIVESFSYIFQSAGGTLRPMIPLRDVRVFKEAWAQFSNPDTELLERQNLARFLAQLDGVLEVRIYPSEYSIKSILRACQDKAEKDDPKTGGVDLRKLNVELDNIDFKEIRKRRAVYIRIYHEADLMCRRTEKRGISFMEMLELLAHYTLIDDKEALGPKELKTREAILELVMKLVKPDRVVSQLRMKTVRRRYLQQRNRSLGAGPGTPPWSHPYNGEGWCSEYDLAGFTLSPRTLVASPEFVARERTGSRDDLPDDPDALHSPTRQPCEETRLLQDS